jgi:MFS family permease
MQEPILSAGSSSPPSTVDMRDGREAARLRDISPQQWKSGIAAWLGWLFDGLDMHLYTLVATPFVALLLTTDPANPVSQRDPAVGYYGSLIQAAFMAGWALGGGLFGRIGDRLGRSRALMLTILTYALFTGLSFFAQTWWHLFICRFLAALGIGGEWAVGASLLSETWPKRWRPWIAAVLQSAVNIGIIIAMAAGYLMSALPDRCVFLVGILPALMVVWIRRAVPEPEEWRTAKSRAAIQPRLADLFRGAVKRTTLLTIVVCALSLTAHWVFMYWYLQHLRNLPDVAAWTDQEKTRLASQAMAWVIGFSTVGNFAAGVAAKLLGYRKAIAASFVLYFCFMFIAFYRAPNSGEPMLRWYLLWYAPIGLCSGGFGLFTMYMPPLFPTLLRTTGAGFCYNIGRIVAAGGIMFFGIFSQMGDHRLVLLYSSFLFLPAAAVAMLLSEPPDEIVRST